MFLRWDAIRVHSGQISSGLNIRKFSNIMGRELIRAGKGFRDAVHVLSDGIRFNNRHHAQ